MEETTLKAYEIGYLVRSEEAKEILIDHLKRFGAKILSEGEVRSLKLAYPIERLSSACFGYLHFEINPMFLADLNNALKLDNQIVRFLIITPPFLKDRSSRPGPPQRGREPTRARIEESLTSPREGTAVPNDLLEEKLRAFSEHSNL